MNRAHNISGFTLIELLVTVSIVGILASISVANFEQYRVQAYNVQNIAALNMGKTIAMALENDVQNGCTQCENTDTYSWCQTGASFAGSPVCADAYHNLAQTVHKLMPDKQIKSKHQYLFVMAGRASNVTATNYKTHLQIHALNCRGNQFIMWSRSGGGEWSGQEVSLEYRKRTHQSHWDHYCGT